MSITDWGTITVGRLTLREVFELDANIDASTGLRSMTLRGQESMPPLTLAQLRARQEDILGLKGRFVQIAFTNKPDHDGYYRIEDASAGQVKLVPPVAGPLPDEFLIASQLLADDSGARPPLDDGAGWPVQDCSLREPRTSPPDSGQGSELPPPLSTPRSPSPPTRSRPTPTPRASSPPPPASPARPSDRGSRRRP